MNNDDPQNINPQQPPLYPQQVVSNAQIQTEQILAGQSQPQPLPQEPIGQNLISTQQSQPQSVPQKSHKAPSILSWIAFCIATVFALGLGPVSLIFANILLPTYASWLVTLLFIPLLLRYSILCGMLLSILTIISSSIAKRRQINKPFLSILNIITMIVVDSIYILTLHQRLNFIAMAIFLSAEVVVSILALVIFAVRKNTNLRNL